MFFAVCELLNNVRFFSVTRLKLGKHNTNHNIFLVIYQMEGGTQLLQDFSGGNCSMAHLLHPGGFQQAKIQHFNFTGKANYLFKQ